MRSRKPLLVAVITILISAALAIGSWGESKTDMLRKLRESAAASPSSLAKDASALARGSRTEATQLAFDLIVYRWLWPRSTLPSDITAETSTDIAYIDGVIAALSAALDDDVVRWATAYFTVDPHGNIPLAPRGDKRPEALANLRRYVEAARQARESSPVNAVKALFDACSVCNDKQFYMEITRALLLKEIADHYQNTMYSYAQAESRYNEASWIFGNYDCPIAYAATYENWAELGIKRGLYSNTAKYYELAAQRWVELSQKHPNGYEYLNLAGQDYIRAGYALSATTQKSDAPMNMMLRGLDRLEEWTHARGKTDKSYDTLIRNLLEVAGFLRERSETSRAKSLLEKAQTLCEKQNDLLLQAKLYGEFEKLYRVVGQDGNADKWSDMRKESLRDAVTTAGNALNSLSASEFSSRSERITFCETLERGARANHELGDYSSAAATWRQAADHYKKLNMVDEQIRALRSLAAELDSQQLAEKSLEARFEAVITAVQAGKNADAAAIVPDMIRTYTELGDLNNALEAFKELAPIYEAAGNIRGVAQVLEARGLLLAKNGQYEQAAKDFAEARRNYIDNVGDPWAAGEVSARLAEAYAATDRLESARDILESSLDDIEGRYRTENLNSSANADRNKLLMNIYASLAEAYVHTGQKDRASSLLGKRGRLYTWCPALVKTLANGSDPVVAAFANSLPLTTGDPVEIDPAGGNPVWASDWTEFVPACWRLQQNHRIEYDAIPVNPLDLFKHHARVPRDTAVVLYMVTDTSLYTFVCDYEKATIKETRLKRSDLEATIRQLRKCIRTCEGNVSEGIPVQEIATWKEPVFQDISEPLRELYGQLIEEVKSEFEDRTRLVFVLPDELSGLPMHALISSKDEAVPKFLVEDYEIGYLGRGMLEYLVSRDDILDSGTAKLIVFSDPDSNLPGAQDEVKKILRNYPNNSKAYQRNSATETSFLRECQTAGIIHIAAHHRIDADPARFELLLARDDEADGIVGIDELAAIQAPQLGLVVLSACDSIASSDPISTGPSRAAEVFSLIGAKSVMGGLWKVSDEAAATMMDVFYSNIAKGHVSRAESLRRAQLAMIESKKFAHPFYWACFALYGNPR